MTILDSPALVAFITVFGSGGATICAAVLNKRVNKQNGDADVIRGLIVQLEEKESIIRGMRKK